MRVIKKMGKWNPPKLIRGATAGLEIVLAKQSGYWTITTSPTYLQVVKEHGMQSGIIGSVRVK